MAKRLTGLQRRAPKLVKKYLCRVCSSSHPSKGAAERCQRLETPKHRFRVTQRLGKYYTIRRRSYRLFRPGSNLPKLTSRHLPMYEVEMPKPVGGMTYYPAGSKPGTIIEQIGEKELLLRLEVLKKHPGAKYWYDTSSMRMALARNW